MPSRTTSDNADHNLSRDLRSKADPGLAWIGRALVVASVGGLVSVAVAGYHELGELVSRTARSEERLGAHEQQAAELRAWLGRIEAKLDRVIERPPR